MKDGLEQDRRGVEGAIEAVLTALRLEDPPPGMAAAIMAQVRRNPQERAGTRVDWRAFIGGLLAGSVLAVAAVWALAVWAQRLFSAHNLALWRLESWYYQQRLELVFLQLGESLSLLDRDLLWLTRLVFVCLGALLLGGAVVFLSLQGPGRRRLED